MHGGRRQRDGWQSVDVALGLLGVVFVQGFLSDLGGLRDETVERISRGEQGQTFVRLRVLDNYDQSSGNQRSARCSIRISVTLLIR